LLRRKNKIGQREGKIALSKVEKERWSFARFVRARTER